MPLKPLPVFTLLAILAWGVACVTAEDAQKADAFRELGLTYLHEGNTPDALRMLLDARDLNPRDARIHHELGLAYFSKELYPQAEESLLEALRLDPELSDARMNLGALYIATGRYEDAAAMLERAAADPLYHKPYRAYNNLGIVYTQLDRPEDAVKAYRQCLKLAPGFCQAHYNLGLLLRDQGEWKTADYHFTEAATRCKDDGRFQLEYAALLVRDERYDEARPILEGIVAADPMGELGARARELLQVLR